MARGHTRAMDRDPGSAAPSPVGGWNDGEQVAWYLERIGRLEARVAGESMLVDLLPPTPRRAARARHDV